jgi:pyridoxine kinase
VVEWLDIGTQYLSQWFKSTPDLNFIQGMTENTTIIIHSRVAIGYVGSNTTGFVLQMGGYEVITVPTVLYSNHLGYTTVGGGKIPEELFSDILKGILKLEILKNVSTIITGFIGSAEQVRIIADFIRTIKKYKPEILYLCDPVMGDIDKGQYVEPDVPDAIIEHLIPLADLLTPNQFEAERIINKQIGTAENIALLLQERFDLSKKKIVITGGGFDVSRKDLIYNCIVENKNCNIIKTRKIDLHPPGTGELFTAHLYLSILRGMKLRDAVALSGDILSAVLLKMYSNNRTNFELRDILFSMNILK